MFCDISGFTDLTQRLVDKGPAGLEELTGILNPYFRHLFAVIKAHGGDTLKVAGDGVLAVWEEEPEPDIAALRAAQCALAIQAADLDPSKEAALSTRIGLASGSMDLFFLGGLVNRWEMLPVGELLSQLGYAQGRAKPGEIALSESAWEQIRIRASSVPIDPGFVRLTGVHSPIAARPLVTVQPEKVNPTKIQRFVPTAARFLIHEAGENWSAELRPVAVLFVNFPQPKEIRFDLETLQSLTASLQKTIYRFEGSLKQWNFDEKGMSLVAVFGLPPFSHEDDPWRAVQAARDIRRICGHSELALNLGVASGRVFCGSIGGEDHREYAVIGSVINLASRLAGKAENGILCDQPTFHASAARIQFEALPPMLLKGIARPMSAFRPVASIVAPAKRSPLVGHQAEWANLEKALAGLSNGQAFLGLIEGDPGIGKSTLLLEWTRLAAAQGFCVLVGSAEAVQSSTPYYIWRSVLVTILGLPETENREESRQKFFEVVAGKDWERLAPLLEDALELGIPDNSITAQITGKSRADTMRELVLKLLLAYKGQRRLVLVLEDAHWMDSASLALAAFVSEQIEGMALVLSSRPVRPETHLFSHELLQRPDLTRLPLLPLGQTDCVALVAQKLAVRRIAPRVAEFIVRKAQGNPFFSVEIAFALREHGFVVIAADECQPVPGVNLDAVRLPESVHGLISQRVDALNREIQLAAKVASVIGMSFCATLLRDIYPLLDARDEVPQYLERLEFERLIHPDNAPSEFVFSNALVRDAVYDRLLEGQKTSLHGLVATELEKLNASDLQSIAPLLGYHWQKAGDQSKAARFFGLAGEHGVTTGAYQEGLGFLDAALVNAEPEARGRLLRLRAAALFGLGRIGESSQEFRNAAAALGCPMTEERIGRRLRQQVSTRVVRRLTPSKALADSEQEKWRELSTCYEMISLLDLFANRMQSSLSAALESLSCAERLGDSPEYARSLATMALACSLIPNTWLADAYGKQAVRVAERLGEESTKARVFEFTAIYLVGQANWQLAEERLQEAINAFRLVGDYRREIECTRLLSTLNHYRGRFEERVRLGQEVSRLAELSGDLLAVAWGLLDQIESLLSLGEFERVDDLGSALRNLGQNIYGADEIMAYGLLGSLELRVGRLESAWTYADKALAVMTAVTPTVVYNLEAYAAVAEIYLAAWEQDQAVGQATFSTRARQALDALHRFARVFRIASPRARIIYSRWHRLNADINAALRSAQAGLRLAQQLQMPYEQALAHREIASLLPAQDSRRTQEVDAALALFEQLRTRYDLSLTTALKQRWCPA
jgi:class 3 adenylate cyclase